MYVSVTRVTKRSKTLKRLTYNEHSTRTKVQISEVLKSYCQYKLIKELNEKKNIGFYVNVAKIVFFGASVKL